jgi:hypothetical protein
MAREGRRADDRVPELLIEQLLLDELPPRRKARLLRSPYVRQRLEELQASNRTILVEYPVQEMAQRIRERAALQGLRGGVRGFFASPRRLVPALGFALLLVAAGVVIVARHAQLSGAQGTLQETRLKGGEPHLVLHRKAGTGVEVLSQGARAQQGDMLQIGYVAGPGRFGVILSIDGSGVVTLHFPAEGAAAAGELSGPGEVLLPFSYRLDAAPRFERFFFLSSQRSFPVQAVLRAAEALAASPERVQSGTLSLPRGVAQSSLLLIKG